jgi:hypothetical protein
MPKGDDLMIQGATVPLGSQPVLQIQPGEPPKPNGEEDDDGA